MMMPANFSAVAENELTYVVGGASLADYLAPAMKAENWQKFNKNLIMIVGNGYLNKYMGTALGHVFSGNYRIGDTTTATFDVLTGNWKANMEYGKEHGWGLLNAVANVGLQAAGGLSAIYALGNGDVGLKLSAKNIADGVLSF
jgi:hypothetical protein